MEDFEVARAVVTLLRQREPSPSDNCIVELVELVSIADQVGFHLLWTQRTSDQGVRRFGLSTTLTEMVHGLEVDASDVDRIEADLWLAIVEPHESRSPDSRTMFFALP